MKKLSFFLFAFTLCGTIVPFDGAMAARRIHCNELLDALAEKVAPDLKEKMSQARGNAKLNVFLKLSGTAEVFKNEFDLKWKPHDSLQEVRGTKKELIKLFQYFQEHPEQLEWAGLKPKVDLPMSLIEVELAEQVVPDEARKTILRTLRDAGVELDRDHPIVRVDEGGKYIVRGRISDEALREARHHLKNVAVFADPAIAPMVPLQPHFTLQEIPAEVVEAVTQGSSGEEVSLNFAFEDKQDFENMKATLEAVSPAISKSSLHEEMLVITATGRRWAMRALLEKASEKNPGGTVVELDREMSIQPEAFHVGLSRKLQAKLELRKMMSDRSIIEVLVAYEGEELTDQIAKLGHDLRQLPGMRGERIVMVDLSPENVRRVAEIPGVKRMALSDTTDHEEAQDFFGIPADLRPPSPDKKKPDSN